jgi:hypothetical protein
MKVDVPKIQLLRSNKCSIVLVNHMIAIREVELPPHTKAVENNKCLATNSPLNLRCSVCLTLELHFITN